jgi:hypothetical protein
LVTGLAFSAFAENPGAYFEKPSDLADDGARDFSSGYAAAVYDTVSWLVHDIRRSNGNMSTEKAMATFRCLDARGHTLGELADWARGVWRDAQSDSSGAVALLRVCVP